MTASEIEAKLVELEKEYWRAIATKNVEGAQRLTLHSNGAGMGSALFDRIRRHTMADKDKPSYLDENLTERDKESGQTRLPQPNEESPVTDREDPYPGRENRADESFERPDEFGDGDRRS